jgi:hypothetical protein
MPLLTFTGNRLIPQPNWGYGVVKMDLGKLQPLGEVVQQLQWEELMGVNHQRMFFSCQIQRLCQRVTKMRLYPGSNCLDRSFSEELSEAEINTWMHKVLDNEANLNPWASPAPSREGPASSRVSLFGYVSAICVISSSHRTRDLAHELEDALREKASSETHPHEGRRHVNHTSPSLHLVLQSRQRRAAGRVSD